MEYLRRRILINRCLTRTAFVYRRQRRQRQHSQTFHHPLCHINDQRAATHLPVGLRRCHICCSRAKRISMFDAVKAASSTPFTSVSRPAVHQHLRRQSNRSSVRYHNQPNEEGATEFSPFIRQPSNSGHHSRHARRPFDRQPG